MVADRYLRAVHWDQDPDTVIINKLNMAFPYITVYAEGFSEAVSIALGHSPWEIALVTVRKRDSGELRQEQAESALRMIREAIQAHSDDPEWFWSGLKSVLIIGDYDLFRDAYLKRCRERLHNDFKAFLNEYRREVSVYCTPGNHAVSERETSILTLRSLQYFSDLTDDGVLMKNFIGQTRIDSRITRSEEQELYTSVCLLYEKKHWYEAIRWMNLKYSKSFRPLVSMIDDAFAYVDRVIEQTPDAEKSGLMSLVRTVLNERSDETDDALRSYEVNEQWYGIVNSHRAAFSRQFDLFYWIHRLLYAGGKEEQIINDMPDFPEAEETVSQEYIDYLMIHAHGHIMLTAPANDRLFFQKTSVYDRFSNPLFRIVKDIPAMKGREEELPESLNHHLPFVNPFYTIDVNEFLRAYSGKGRSGEDMVWLYMHTYLRSGIAMDYFLKLMDQCMGRSSFSQVNINAAFGPYEFYGICGYYGAHTVNNLRITDCFNARLKNAMMLGEKTGTVKDGDIVRFRIYNYDVNRGALIFDELSAIDDDKENVLSSESTIRSFLKRIVEKGTIDHNDLLDLSSFPVGRSHDFEEKVDDSLMFAEACGSAGNNRHLVDDFMHLFRRVSNYKFAYLLYKKTPSFRMKSDERIRTASMEAKTILQNLSFRIRDKYILLKIYMETVLSNLISFEEAMQTIYHHSPAKGIDFGDAMDPEHYWIKCRKTKNGNAFDIIPDTSLIYFRNRRQYLFVPSNGQAEYLAQQLNEGTVFAKPCRLVLKDLETVEIEYNDIVNENTLHEKTSEAAFEESLRKYSRQEYMSLSQFVDDWGDCLASSAVARNRQTAEILAIYEYRMIRRESSLEEMNELVSLLGDNNMYSEDSAYDIHRLRLSWIIPTHIHAAMERLIAENQPGQFISLYFNSFFRAVLDLGALCSSIQTAYPQMDVRMLADLFDGHLFRVKKNTEGDLYTVNAVCRNAEFMGEKEGVYVLYRFEEGTVYFKPLTEH